MAIDIKGLDKAEVLAALYNNSRQQGMGFLDGRGQQKMTADQARELLKEETSFDYLYGRVMKIQLEPEADTFEEYLYDRDNGKGAAQDAIDSLLAA